jgi:uroporphyrinogen-III synthase
MIQKKIETTDSIHQPAKVSDNIEGPLKVLITRPDIKGKQLAKQLSELKIAHSQYALFDYQVSASSAEIKNAVKTADMLIFVSVAAVNFCHARLPLSQVNHMKVFAIGDATKQALLTLGVKKVFSPDKQQEHSEGLLKLPELLNISHTNIVVFRGNGGRELIANTLKQRGAEITYIESYQRVWRTLPKDISQQWRAQQINCIVVTSNDILLALAKALTNQSHQADNFWRSHCLWVVASERIAATAKTLGLKQVINSQGANTESVCNTLLNIAGL